MKLPSERGGWWHAYVCPAHGVELDHVDLLSGEFPAGGAPCSYGCRIDTPAVRGAWTVLAHQACAAELLSQARAGEDVTADLESYARLYASAAAEVDPGVQSWMLRGTLFHQALTESIWAVTIARAAWPARTPAIAELLRRLTDAAAEARDKLVAEGKFTSNYVAWLTAAGYLCSRDPEWLEGEHGLYNHLLAATSEDGWQWEASTYYHSFVLRAAVLATEGLTVPDKVADRMQAMGRVLDNLRFGDHLAALHDGPYRRPGYTAELVELGSPRPAPNGVTVCATYAVLRTDELLAIVDFGPHGGSHGHRDKLSLYLYGRDAWQPDPGQVPYGHTGWRRYYASTAAHPTFRIDDQEQAECTGRLIEATDRSVTVACDDAYPGVTATRRVTIAGGELTDELVVECTDPRKITAQLRPGVPLVVNGMTTDWGSLRGEHVGPPEFLVRPGPGPADDPQRVVQQVDWSAYDATRATFSSTYRTEV
ncbi:heparinase II/III family protein [Kribbella sp. NPDC051952]|uniref:heparinase II/III domain-containing protein n=1 Tax=Kribbella sp. NPDC051952 TaxID=3154851 RepID=UPI00342A99A5